MILCRVLQCCREKQEKRNSVLTSFQESDFSVSPYIFASFDRTKANLVSKCSQDCAESNDIDISSALDKEKE